MLKIVIWYLKIVCLAGCKHACAAERDKIQNKVNFVLVGTSGYFECTKYKRLLTVNESVR